MSNKRNIINEEQVLSLISEYSNKWPHLAEFIDGTVRNFLFKRAISQEHNFYFLNKFKLKKTKRLKQILKNGGPFHEIIVNNTLIQRIDNVINFVELNPNVLKNKKIGFDGIELMHSKWIKSLNKRIKTNEGEVDLVYSFSDGKTIVKLIDDQAYCREGSLMKHCVSAYSSRKNIDIYSLRNEINEPLVTMEVQDYVIKQISEKCNKEISKENKKYINEFALANNYKFNFIKKQIGMAGIMELTMSIWLNFNWKEVAKFALLNNNKAWYDLIVNSHKFNSFISLSIAFLTMIKLYNFIISFSFYNVGYENQDQI